MASRWGPAKSTTATAAATSRSNSPMPPGNNSNINGNDGDNDNIATILEREDGFTVINSVEWGEDDASDLDELAARPRPDRSDDPCGCTRDDGVITCNDLSCVLFACQEECRSNCLAGKFCGNKRIQRRQWKPIQVFDAGKKGRGLKVLQDVKKGDFITEYCGRAVNRKFLPRLFQRYGNERKLYIMALDKDIYLDARTKGSLARYINHSCEPNCVVERWKVRGILRAAVIASKDMPAGTELSFDYQWERKRGRAPTKCHCGKPTCRGTLEVPRSMEEEELERKLSIHWKKPFMMRPQKEIVNRCVKVLSRETQEYFTGDVTSYDPNTGKHLILYKHDLEEVWEDLKQEDWMLLDEEAEQFIIRKKVVSPQRHDGVNSSTHNTPSLTSSQSLLQSQQQQQQQHSRYTSHLPNVHLQGQQQFGKNYIYVQTHIKEALASKHLIERCQRSCRVTITPEEFTSVDDTDGNTATRTILEIERRERTNAMRMSTDGSVWKLSIVGYDIPKALSILEKNVTFIERKFFPETAAASSTGPNGGDYPSMSAAQSGGSMLYNGNSMMAMMEGGAGTGGEELPAEVILPRCIVESAKRRLPILRDKCRSVNITFVPSESKSKQFAKLVLEGTLKSDIESAKEHLWQQLNIACQEQKAPKTPSGLYKDLCFLGGEMSSSDFRKLLEYEKTDMASAVYKSTHTQDAKEDLTRWSPFFASFEATHRCTIWVHNDADKGRIDSSNRIVNEATPNAPRKIYFGCEPSQITKLWDLVQKRAKEAGRGVKYLYLGPDRLYQPMMMKNRNGSQFFDFVCRVTGAVVEIDSMTGDHLRIDGKGKNEESNPTDGPADNISEGERAGLAEEIIRLQIELFRDHCIRQQNWIFGRDWSLANRSSGQRTSKAESSSSPANPMPGGRTISPIPGGTSSSASRYFSFDSKMLINACVEISDIVSTLGLEGSIAAHATVIMYRFSVMQKMSSTETQLKIREVVLAAVFLANKAQKLTKFKPLETVLEAAYSSFYPGVVFDPKKEEALVWEEKVIAAETEILDSLDYDVFWRGFDWIEVTAAESGMDPRIAKRAVAFSVSGPILAAGADLWLGYGPEHVFAAAAGFLDAEIDKLFPALNLIPMKVSQVAEMLASSIKATPSGKKQIWDPRELKEMLNRLPSIKQTCTKCMLITLRQKNSRPLLSEMEQRYKIIGDRSRQRRTFQRVPSEVVKEVILPVLDGICAESNCSIFIEQNKEAESQYNLVLEGSWRAFSIASYLLEQAVQGRCRLEQGKDGMSDLSSQDNVESKGKPGLLEMKKVETVDAWTGTVQSEITNLSYWGRKTGGKCCVPGKTKESVLRQAGLRWWLPPRYGPSPSGSICDMFLVNNNASDALEALANLTRTFQGESAAFSMLTSSLASKESAENNGVSDRFVAVSLQRWPTEKVAKREQRTIEKKKEKKESKKKRRKEDEMQMGFSPGALQEMQLLHKLHGLIKSPQGHPNFILPVGVALPAEAEKKDNDLATNGSKSLDLKRIDEDIEDIFSLTRTSLGNEIAARDERKRKDMATGPHILFYPTPFILSRFAPGKKKLDEKDNLSLTPAMFGTWFHDLLSALLHCHSNDIILRTFQLDQIMVDHSGVAKFGGFYRASILSEEDKQADVIKLARSTKKWDERKRKRADEDILSNPNAAPELLLGSPKYTKETDIWTLGCLLANLLLNKPLFSGKSRDSRLLNMFKIIGTPSPDNFEEAAKFPNFDKPLKKYHPGISKALLSMLGPTEGEKHAGAIDLIEKMLNLDPRKRITAIGALQHEYMQNYTEQCASGKFQQEFVRDWILLKKSLTKSSQNKEEEIKERERGMKRKAMLMAATTTTKVEEEDDLYDMDDILGGPANKLSRLH